MYQLIILYLTIAAVAGLAFGIHFKVRHANVLKKYDELRAMRDSYIENVVDRISVNESALVKKRTLLNVSINQLETLAANSGRNWEILADKNASFVSSIRDTETFISEEAESNRLVEITQQLREQIYSYIPDDISHLGGTIQQLDDFLEFVRLSVKKFNIKKGIEIQLRINADSVDTSKYIFHDQDFVVRWFIFLSMFAKEEKTSSRPPSLEIKITSGETPASCHIKTAFVMFKKSLLPANFNEQYEMFFYTGRIPDEWDGLNPYFLEALKMSSVFSVMVRGASDDKFGNTMLYFERDAYVSEDRTAFDHIVALRRKYTASKLCYVSSVCDEIETDYVKDIFSNIGLNIQIIPFSEFNASLLSRTIMVFISHSLDKKTRDMVIAQALGSPFAKVRVCVIKREDEDVAKHERIEQINIPLSSRSISQIL